MILDDKNTQEVWDRIYKNSNVEQFIKNSLLEDPWTLHHKPIIDKYAQALDSGALFVEAGCGLGQWCFYIANRYNIKTLGVDISHESINKLNNYLIKTDKTNLISFIADDLNQTQLEMNSCDMFISLGVVEHFEDQEPMLRSLFKILKPLGTGLISVPNIYSMHSITRPLLQIVKKWHLGYETSFSPCRLMKLAKKIGFDVIEYGIIPSGEIFGCFLNSLPVVGNVIKKIGRSIEEKQKTFGFISYVVVTK